MERIFRRFDVIRGNTIIRDIKWNLVCESSWLSSLAGSAYFLGFFVSAVVSGQISDRCGRKPVILSGLVIHITFGILCSFSPYYWMFVASRFLLSVGVTATHLTLFVYVMEVVGPTSRERVIVIQCFSYSLGMLLLTGVSWFLRDWSHIQLCCTFPSIMSLVFIGLIPESPRWLLTHGRLHKAEDVIQNIMNKNKRHVNDLTEIIEELHWKIKTTGLLWLRIVFVVLCRFCISIASNTIYGFTLELYPTVVRNVGIGSCSTVGRIGAIAAPFMKDLSEKVNWSIPFVIVGVLTILCGMCILPLPETKSVRLNDTIVKLSLATSEGTNMMGDVGQRVNAEPTFDMKIRFSDTLNALLQEKANNSGILTRDKYGVIIQNVKQAQAKQKKGNVDCCRLRKYNVIQVDGKEKIVPVTGHNNGILDYALTEELFDILH
ncbi:organic cation transporter protein-like [Centruroides vittatus]|uniref:organic cation transporter protein-like n=1 Tax=Centruroides vittatus TaxID=120091 RepID=UPI00350FB148